MSTVQIEDGGRTSIRAEVAEDGRLRTDAAVERISANRSRAGELWGLGTGFLTIPAALDLGSPLLWFKNTSTDEDWYIEAIIGGHTGSQSNPGHNIGIATLIEYTQSAPTANNNTIFATIENISKSSIDTSSSQTTGTRKANFEGYAWNESGTAGMTSGTGGWGQIPNSWAIGHTRAEIQGEVILGPGKSMQMIHMNNNLATSDTAELHLSVVFWVQGANKERAES